MKCPECDKKAIPIVYGLPGSKMFKDAKKGKVKLGGCILSLSSPGWHCPKCDKDF